MQSTDSLITNSGHGIQIGNEYGFQGMHIIHDETYAIQTAIRMGRPVDEQAMAETVFDIDGAGGERISAVSVGTKEVLGH